MTDERQGWTSASNAESDLLCPGRHLAQKGLPEFPESEDAASGTRIHAWLAEIKKVELSPEELQIAESCKAIKNEILVEWMKPESSAYGHVEERLWAEFGNLRHSGQADFVSIQGNRALCIDFKSGRNEVSEPNTNQQLRDLAVLVHINYPVTEVTVCIVQPFAHRNPPCVYDEVDLQMSALNLASRVKASNRKNAKRVAGEKQCKYCRAKTSCKEYAAWTLTALPSIASADLGIQKPWTPEQWSNFLTIAPEAESWIETKRQEAKALLKESPEAIPGFALGDSGTRDKITDVQAVFEQASARGVTTDAFMSAVTVTKKGLRDALRSAGMKGQELEQAMTELLFGNVESKEIEPKIVRKKTCHST